MKPIPTKYLFIISFAAAFVLFGLFVLISDYSAYRQERKWYAQLHRDLPSGTPARLVRKYLVDEGNKNGIRGLRETEEFGVTKFIFENHNTSTIIALLKKDNQSLLEEYVIIELDEQEKLKEIYSQM